MSVCLFVCVCLISALMSCLLYFYCLHSVCHLDDAKCTTSLCVCVCVCPISSSHLSSSLVLLFLMQVQRPPGPPYTAHEISKAHPNLAATPPGHASSPGLSQVSVSTVSTGHLYGHPKGWEAGGGVSEPTGRPHSLCPTLSDCLCLL